MKRRFAWPRLRSAGIVAGAACLIGLTWLLAVHARRAANVSARNAVATELQQQVGALDNRLQTMAQAWQLDPQHFPLATWSTILTRPDGTRPNLLLVNAQGIVVESNALNTVGASVAAQDWFRTAEELARKNNPSTINAVRMADPLHWRILVAHWLRAPDHGFGGVVAIDAELDALSDLFHPVAPPSVLGRLTGPRPVLYGEAGAITVVLMVLAWLLLTWKGKAQAEASLQERGMLAAANNELLAARARADAKAAVLDATVTGVSDGVAVLDPQLRLMEWNQHFADLAGVPAHLLQPGTTMEQILRTQAEAGEFGQVDVASEVARRLDVLRSLQSTQTAERARPDGRVIELRRNPLPDGGFVTLYRDITARRKAEAAMRDAHATVEAAAAAKSRFVAIVSHEIRSPLGALLNTLQLLGGTSLPPAQQTLLRMARQSGEALLGLVNDILDLSSMEAGQLSLRPTVFALAPLLNGVLEIFTAQASERGITLRLATDPSMPEEIYADPGRLRQVLVNLLSNAVKFGIPGPVMLLVRPDRDAHGRAMLYLAVRDRGPVIEPAGRARLFRPFSRLDLGGEEPLASGIGLAICRYLVTLMGGEIGCDTWMAEDRHAGNEFWVQLPLAPVPSGVRPRASSSEAPARLLLPRSRILLVEDIAANQLVTALLLRREGHMVDVAESGEAALYLLSRHPYDVVFTDIHLPGMNGLDLSRRIGALPGASGRVPVVALSANTGPEDRLDCERAGIRDLLEKPVAVADLLSAVAQHVWRGLPARIATPEPAPPFPAPPLLAEDRLNELRTHLPPDALRGMVQECLVDLQARLPALRGALLAGDTASATSQAHAMLGMAAGYGMAALERRLRAIMAATRGPHEAAAGVLLQQLEADLAQSGQALREALEVELV